MIFPPLPLANYAALLAVKTAAKAIKPFKPIGFQSGGQTYYDGPGTVAVCDDGAAWIRVWGRHTGNEWIGTRNPNTQNPTPEFDFDKDFVVAVFAGPTRNVVGYRLVAGYSFGTQATLRLVPVVDPSPGASIAIPSPWAFLVLPRSKATVSIQIAAGDGWRTVAQAKPAR